MKNIKIISNLRNELESTRLLLHELSDGIETDPKAAASRARLASLDIETALRRKSYGSGAQEAHQQHILRQKRAIYSKGVAAAQEGLGSDACPFKGSGWYGILRKAWHAGYDHQVRGIADASTYM